MVKFYAQCNTVWKNFGDKGGFMLKDMIAAKSPISHKEFLATCDTSPVLEDEESLKDFLSSDPEAGVFKSMFNNEPCYFIQYAGFEFIWLLSSSSN
jgi:hypothetical protein